MNAKKGLIVVTLIAALAACGLDFWTSYQGFRAAMANPNASPLAQIVPIVLATLALGLNGLSSYIVPSIQEQVKEGKQSPLAAMAFTVGFFCLIAFDAISSWAGFLMTFAGTNNLRVAVESADQLQWILATVSAILITLGPFCTMLLYDLLQKEGGLMGNV